MTVSNEPPLTTEEKAFEQALSHSAAFHLGAKWRDCWVEHTDDDRPIGYLNALGPCISMETLIEKAEANFAGDEAVLFIENITLRWTIKLGAAWNLVPKFFVSHVRPLDDRDVTQTLHEGRVPNSRGGLKSWREKTVWATLRGFVDHSKPNKHVTATDLVDKSKRQHEEGIYGHRMSHTNFSFYRVSEALRMSLHSPSVNARKLTKHHTPDILLIDRIPRYQPHQALQHLRWFPNQEVIHVATVDSPGYLTIPQLGWSHLSATFPIWTLFNDVTHKRVLLEALKADEIDGFMYLAALLECERQVANVSLDIEEINERQGENDGLTTDESLPNTQKVATRLKRCTQENRAYEDKLRRASTVGAKSYTGRNEFEKLAVRFSELDHLLVQCFYRRMTILTAAGTKENLAQTQAAGDQARATLDQTRSMGTLTWLAFFYVPLTFATGIFGMNVKEIDSEKELSWRLFAKVAMIFLAVTFVVAVVLREMQKCWGRALPTVTNENGNRSWFGKRWSRADLKGDSTAEEKTHQDV